MRANVRPCPQCVHVTLNIYSTYLKTCRHGFSVGLLAIKVDGSMLRSITWDAYHTANNKKRELKIFSTNSMIISVLVKTPQQIIQHLFYNIQHKLFQYKILWIYGTQIMDIYKQTLEAIHCHHKNKTVMLVISAIYFFMQKSCPQWVTKRLHKL